MDRLNDLISKEEVLKHQVGIANENGIGISFYDVVFVSEIEKMPTVNAIVIPEGQMNPERAMEILNNVVNFVSIGNDTKDTINELLKYGFEAEELVNDFNFSKADVEDATGEKIEEAEEERE